MAVPTTVTDLHAYACTVTWGGTNLGLIEGGVDVNIEEMATDLTADQYGDTILDQVIKGKSCTVTVNMTDCTMANMVNAMSEWTETGTSPNDGVYFTLDCGSKRLANAAALVITPIIDSAETTDNELIWNFYKAAPTGPITHRFDLDDQVVWPIVFQCYPDSTNSMKLGYRGYAA